MNPKSKKTVQDTLTLEYDLFSLPTAQHKAGLVGLLLMIESMKRREMSPLPEIVSITDSKAEIRFSKESMQLMFDDLFDAEWIVVTSKTKWKNATPIRIEENENEFDGKKRKEKVYCYKIFQ
ncbi:MAG TPA: hypothetical protein PLH79_07645, partial [bacterium]|nr:hypothetical protein [bacterium]